MHQTKGTLYKGMLYQLTDHDDTLFWFVQTMHASRYFCHKLIDRNLGQIHPADRLPTSVGYEAILPNAIQRGGLYVKRKATSALPFVHRVPGQLTNYLIHLCTDIFDQCQC